MPTNIDTHDLDATSGAVYFAVGRGTEGGPASYHLAIAGITQGVTEPHWGTVNKSRRTAVTAWARSRSTSASAASGRWAPSTATH